jgi:hypothetical protein
LIEECWCEDAGNCPPSPLPPECAPKQRLQCDVYWDHDCQTVECYCIDEYPLQKFTGWIFEGSSVNLDGWYFTFSMDGSIDQCELRPLPPYYSWPMYEEPEIVQLIQSSVVEVSGIKMVPLSGAGYLYDYGWGGEVIGEVQFEEVDIDYKKLDRLTASCGDDPIVTECNQVKWQNLEMMNNCWLAPAGEYFFTDFQALEVFYDKFCDIMGVEPPPLPQDIDFNAEQVIGFVRQGSGCSAEGKLSYIEECRPGGLNVSFEYSFSGTCGLQQTVARFARVYSIAEPVNFIER